MDLTKFKNLAQKMSFLRNYSSLLVPAVIVMVGIFIFVPSQLLSRSLTKQIEAESFTVGKKIKSLNGSVVARDQWKVEHEYQEAYADDANQMALLMKQSSQRPLLSYKIFPEPKDTSMLIFKEFGQRYREAIDKRLAQLNAHDCPTATEISKNVQTSSLAGSADAGRTTGKSTEVDATIVDALCKVKARSSTVYANAADIAGYELWENYQYTGMEQAVQDCWYWQLGYWIIEDVLDTIAARDAGSTTVFDSPVKRLLSIDFTTMSKGGGKKTDVKPAYVTSFNDVLTLPHTNRLGSSDIDVVQFELAVIIRAKEALPFMKELCSAKEHRFRGFSNNLPEQVYKHNQITILGVDMQSVDPAEQANRLYRYGDDAVVKLFLSCEYVFDRSGYGEIKPSAIKPAEKGMPPGPGSRSTSTRR